jgi:hypothetical protein
MLDDPLLVLDFDLNVPRYVDLLLELHEQGLFKLLIVILEVSVVLKEGTAIAAIQAILVVRGVIRELVAQTLSQIDVGFRGGKLVSIFVVNLFLCLHLD